MVDRKGKHARSTDEPDAASTSEEQHWLDTCCRTEVGRGYDVGWVAKPDWFRVALAHAVTACRPARHWDAVAPAGGQWPR